MSSVPPSRIPCSASSAQQTFIDIPHFRPGGSSGLRSSGSAVACPEVCECMRTVWFRHTLIRYSLSRSQHAVTMVHLVSQPTPSVAELVRTLSDQYREGGGFVPRLLLILKLPCWIDLAYILLQSLPRFRLARLRERINPLLEFDILGVCLFLVTKPSFLPDSTAAFA